MFAAAHASAKLSGNDGTTAAITRVFDEVSFSWFAGTSGLGRLASRLALSVFLDVNRLKIFGTGMSRCWEEMWACHMTQNLRDGNVGFKR